MPRHARPRPAQGRRDRRAHHTVAAWRDTPWFTDAERAALALAEDLTRLADRPDAVPDEVWDAAAAEHYDEQQLAALILAIGMINLWNRLNITRQVPAGTDRARATDRATIARPSATAPRRPTTSATRSRDAASGPGAVAAPVGHDLHRLRAEHDPGRARPRPGSRRSGRRRRG